jgi:hypothetical protein
MDFPVSTAPHVHRQIERVRARAQDASGEGYVLGPRDQAHHLYTSCKSRITAGY